MKKATSNTRSPYKSTIQFPFPMALFSLSPPFTADHATTAFLIPKLHHTSAAPFPTNNVRNNYSPPVRAQCKWRANASFTGLPGNSKSKKAEAIKQELLEAIEPLDCGAEATPEDQNMIDRITRRLEAVNPTKQPLKSNLINGKWELIYTTSQPILQNLRPKLLRSRRNYQAINADTLRAQNMESAPFFNQVTADLTPLNLKKFAVKFDFFKLGGLIRVKAPENAVGTLEITYLDQDLRVSRGDKGNLFVLKMVDPSYRIPHKNRSTKIVANINKIRLRIGGVRQARAIVQRMGDARRPRQQATLVGLPPQEINLISCGPMAHISDIKLIRTDTTLDLSQKAEKGMSFNIYAPPLLYTLFQDRSLLIFDVGTK